MRRVALAARPLGAPLRAPPRRHISSGTLNGVKWFNGSYSNPLRPVDINGMYVVPLGTSSAASTRYRNVSSTLLRRQTYTYMFDCGENTAAQLRNCWMVRPTSVSRIFVTHLHGDHVYGLPAMVASFLRDLGQGLDFEDTWRAVRVPPQGGTSAAAGGDAAAAASPDANAAGAPPPEFDRLTIYGPHGLYQMLSAAFVTYSPNQRRRMPVDVVELLPPGMEPPDAYAAQRRGGVGTVRYATPAPDGTYWLYSSYTDGQDRGCAGGPVTSGPPPGSAMDAANRRKAVPLGVTVGHFHHDVRAGQLDHTTHCVGYVVGEIPRMSVDTGALAAAGVLPGPHLKDIVPRLKAGQPVTLASGAVLTPEAVLRQAAPGVKVAVMGDNSSVSPGMAALCAGADVLIHEATLIPGEEGKARERGHSTAVMAGQFARAVGARSLVLTHFGPSFASGYAMSHVDALGRDKVDAVLEEINELAAGELAEVRGAGGGGGSGKPRPAPPVRTRVATAGAPSAAAETPSAPQSAPGFAARRRQDAPVAPRAATRAAAERLPSSPLPSFRSRSAATAAADQPQQQLSLAQQQRVVGSFEQRFQETTAQQAQWRDGAGGSGSDAGSVATLRAQHRAVVAASDSAVATSASPRPAPLQAPLSSTSTASTGASSNVFRKPFPPPRLRRGMTSSAAADGRAAAVAAQAAVDDAADAAADDDLAAALAAARQAEADDDDADGRGGGGADLRFFSSEPVTLGGVAVAVAAAAAAGGRGGSDRRRVTARGLAALLELAPSLRSGMVGAILECERVPMSAMLGHNSNNHNSSSHSSLGGRRRAAAPTPLPTIRTSPRQNLLHALRSCSGGGGGPDGRHHQTEVAGYVHSYAFPHVTEHKAMQPVVAAAQRAFGSDRVVAARDLMAIVVDTTAGDGADDGGAGSTLR